MTLRDEILEIQHKAKADAERMKRAERAGKKVGEALKEIAQSNPDLKEFILPIKKGILMHGDEQIALINEFAYLGKWLLKQGIDMVGTYDRSECNGQAKFTFEDNLLDRGRCE